MLQVVAVVEIEQLLGMKNVMRGCFLMKSNTNIFKIVIVKDGKLKIEFREVPRVSSEATRGSFQ